MPTNGNLLFLSPCEAGVPSRRHLVVIRRAEAHIQELVNLLAEMNAQVAETGVSAVTPCHTDLIGNKIFLIERAIFELERCTSKARRAQVATRLTALKKEFKAVRDWLKM
jgi:predicted ATPase